MRIDGKDYRLTRLGHQRLGSEANAIGESILGYARDEPLSAGLFPLIVSLLREYDVPPEVLEADVRRFLGQCISEEVLAEPGRMRIYGLDLSITNLCNASCVYCPTPRSRSPKRFLALHEADRIIDGLREPEYRREFGTLTTLELGGLAEPLLHPDALEILRLFKRRYPVPHVFLYTNGVPLTAEMSKALIREDLITSLVISIDGLDDREHRASKRVSYTLVASHLMAFLRAREAAASSCRLVINVLPYARYRSLVRQHLGREPLNAPTADTTLEDRTDAIIRAWRPRLGPGDQIRPAARFFQLRGEDDREPQCHERAAAELHCPWFDYVAHSLSITSDGDVLICCNDFQKESVLGNCLTTNLHEIVAGARRAFVVALARDDRERLPARCRRRSYCQFLSPTPNGDEHDLQG